MKSNAVRRLFSIGVAVLVSLILFAQGGRVVFHVYDGLTGEPIAGATVTITGTTKGTVTDIDGRAILTNVKQTDSYTVSYNGYRSHTDNIGNGTTFTIPLFPDE